MTAELTYKIVRFYREDNAGAGNRVIATGLTLEEAQAHCKDPETSFKNDAGEVIAFDGYEEE